MDAQSLSRIRHKFQAMMSQSSSLDSRRKSTPEGDPVSGGRAQCGDPFNPPSSKPEQQSSAATAPHLGEIGRTGAEVVNNTTVTKTLTATSLTKIVPTLTAMPQETLINIFEHIDPADYYNVQCCCRALRHAAMDPLTYHSVRKQAFEFIRMQVFGNDDSAWSPLVFLRLLSKDIGLADYTRHVIITDYDWKALNPGRRRDLPPPNSQQSLIQQLVEKAKTFNPKDKEDLTDLFYFKVPGSSLDEARTNVCTFGEVLRAWVERTNALHFYSLLDDEWNPARIQWTTLCLFRGLLTIAMPNKEFASFSGFVQCHVIPSNEKVWKSRPSKRTTYKHITRPASARDQYPTGTLSLRMENLTRIEMQATTNDENLEESLATFITFAELPRLTKIIVHSTCQPKSVSKVSQWRLDEVFLKQYAVLIPPCEGSIGTVVIEPLSNGFRQIDFRPTPDAYSKAVHQRMVQQMTTYDTVKHTVLSRDTSDEPCIPSLHPYAHHFKTKTGTAHHLCVTGSFSKICLTLLFDPRVKRSGKVSGKHATAFVGYDLRDGDEQNTVVDVTLKLFREKMLAFKEVNHRGRRY
ncbi:uncharacterized protein KY384_003510 [Bacidia gigantensis]|uniref:uncharacterized protein n=1 Tax=Bacidia gigantensis TaxID=2732470 RepID=UPI001D03DF70|nr:uncharacterized protein KY384_003510 [Bacidia gigantensis]KAG8531874.1 hypothetical protein KY384_003510 [Bacidia gigantensis]